MIGARRIAFALALVGAGVLYGALPLRAELALPAGAQALAERQTPLGTYALPVGSVTAEGVPVRTLEGRILRRSWRIRGEATVLQILLPLRAQLQEGGYEIVFQCEARLCGGFDFRFGIEVVPAPDMAVSIGDYHFLSAIKDEHAVSLLVSRSGGAIYLQVIDVLPPEQSALQVVTPADAPVKPAAAMADPETGAPGVTDLQDRLLSEGHAILAGLDFATGADVLPQASYESLNALATFLADHPQYSVAAVGHTDTVGSLEDNIVLSLSRAEAVKRYLVQTAGVSEDRIATEGAGYLAPIASNLTAEGREANRRVEAVLLPRPLP